jgi:hypothetical protein
VVKDNSLSRKIFLLHATGEVKFLRATVAADDESGMVHVGDEAERFASGGAMVVTGVEIAEFIEAGRNVGQAGEPFEEAGADVVLVAGSGGAGGDGHASLIEFFVEEVHRFLNHFRAGLSSDAAMVTARMVATVARENSVEMG